ncbi:MAG TPA: hypothetical protein EYN51_11390 [Flavobacteriales bacterium]|nr:hypothetical protein [Flavobacteriales bacterium]HIA12782.1 hypothetical protein [Flavobacteriales bacterium]
MKRNIKILTFTAFLQVLTLTSVLACEPIIDKLMRIKPDVIDKYECRRLGRGQIRVQMYFATADFLKPDMVRRLRTITIQQVELIYSDFQMSSSFSQPMLNKARYQRLLEAIPQLQTNSMVLWKATAQTSAKNQVEAKKMFHGFIITARRPSSSSLTKCEMARMEEALKTVEIIVDSIEYRKVDRVRKRKRYTSMYLPVLKSKRVKGVLYKNKGIWNRPRQTYTQIDTVIRIKKIVHYKTRKVPGSKKYVSVGVVDSTFFKVMDRHKDWNNILFVTDVTGSMYNYSVQLMVWHKLNYLENRASQFSFFNDGNRKSTALKKIGSTGGIYHVKGDTYEDVEKEIYKTMSMGGGGDSPENDIEALIAAIKSCPDAEQIVLIADNWSNVRDIELLAEINIPVKVIICGSYSTIVNLQYIELAYKTGGSIHTIEEDITNLMELSSGKSIEIGGKHYLIKNGKFVVLHRI